MRKKVDSGDTAAVVGLGVAAARRGDVAAAEVWYRAAADRGDVDGMNLVGLLCEERGAVAEASRWYARAAAEGDTVAMHGLARIARRDGRLDDAERWYREAADHGDQEAMTAVADLMSSTGRADDEWYRRAAESGDPRALAVLGTRLRAGGELAEAERWLRRAVEVTDEPFFMVELGSVLAERGDLDEAGTWHRRAASAGHVDALGHLGSVLVARGDLARAEEAYREAAGTGRRSAMAALALLLAHRGEVGEAEDWLARAATSAGVEVDHDLWSALPPLGATALDRRERDAATRVLVVLGVLARRQDDVDRAERCLRRAAGVGDAQAMHELGMLLTRWGAAARRAAAHRPGRRVEPVADQPATWFTRAAEAGHPDAMLSLSALHKGRPEGDLWWRRAIAARQADAMEALVDDSSG
ncbi:tetratricopeptide repeat protein [Saccharothrix texasensis]|uniref:TPR repeat protein n=1 Tax=Saccharothrix texasensis TaxID=103734 RepID=A0A3N1HFZ3_9PSEU|nr:tetratricopeptide repeat protein [Saccharothrix texasensis]ROP41391.1 TPR repeat protein [Saccharothrix texasensis]